MKTKKTIRGKDGDFPGTYLPGTKLAKVYITLKNIITGAHIIYWVSGKYKEPATGALQIATLKAELEKDYILNIYSSSSRVDGRHSREDSIDTYITAKVSVCKGIEVLLAHEPMQVLHLIELIKQQENKEELITTFMLGINNAKLSNQSLLNWDEENKQAIINQLNSIKSYGKTLSQSNDSDAIKKGATVVSLVDRLMKKVNDWKENPSNPNQKFDNLTFKLELLRELRSNDLELNKHRGWGRVVANVFSFVLTGGIANAINYMKTGNVLFFDKTTTQEKVSEAEKAIIEFKPK